MRNGGIKTVRAEVHFLSEERGEPNWRFCTGTMEKNFKSVLLSSLKFESNILVYFPPFHGFYCYLQGK